MEQLRPWALVRTSGVRGQKDLHQAQQFDVGDGYDVLRDGLSLAIIAMDGRWSAQAGWNQRR